MRELPNNRNEWGAQFIGRIEQAPDGGTLVVGTIGPEQGMRGLFVVVPVAVLVVGGGWIAIGLWSLLSGHLQLHVTQIASPLVVGAAYVYVLLTRPARVEREVRRLLGTLSGILDATSHFPDEGGYRPELDPARLAFRRVRRRSPMVNRSMVGLIPTLTHR
jgi:hypothetical protein